MIVLFKSIYHNYHYTESYKHNNCLDLSYTMFVVTKGGMRNLSLTWSLQL